MLTTPGPKRSAIEDPARQAALRGLGLPEARTDAFDRLARLAAGVLNAPVALISLVEADRQVIAGAFGLPEPFASSGDAPFDDSFCRSVLEQGEPLVVGDAREDARFRESSALLEFGAVAYLGSPILSADGHVLGAICVIDRVPRRWSAEQIELLTDLAASAMTAIELRHEVLERTEAERRVTYILESITDGFFTVDVDWRFRYVNREAELLLRRSRSELIGTSIWEAFPAIVGSDFERQYRRVVRERTTVTFEAFYPPLQSWYAVHAYPSTEGLSVYFHEINERKQAEARQAASEARYHHLATNLPFAVYVLDAEGRFVELNAAATQVLERQESELLGEPFSTIVSDESLVCAQEVFARVISGETDNEACEAWVLRPSGEKRLLAVTVTSIREEGQITGLHGIGRDITEERESERALRESEERFRQLAKNIDTVFWLYDISAGSFIYCNPAFERVTGIRRERIYQDSRAWIEVIHEEDRARVLRTKRDSNEDGYSLEYRILSPEGEVRWLWERSWPVQNEEGQVYRSAGVVVDVTELKHAEEMLRDSERIRRQAERLASVGTLVGGVAHELNNPLHAILNFAQLLLLDERSAEDREALEIIAREAERMAKIVSDLRQIAKNTQDQAVQKSAVDLNEVIRHVLKVQGYRLRTSNIEVREDLAHDLPRVFADRAQLEQIIFNLVVNAEQAMTAHAGGGRLILRTRISAFGSVLHVVDNGHGIPANQLAHIFDPFFTTKNPGEGMGLGLSLVHSIVSEHGGQIHVDSEVGNGTAFRIDWPRAVEESPARTTTAPETARPEGSLRVLLVDDEVPIRTVMARYLERLGHTVHQADEGAAAIRMLDEIGYDVIISDLRMPGLDGEALMGQLAVRGMAQRAIFVTGDATGAGARMKQAGAPVLHKPAKLDEVARAVAEVVRRHAA